jgi:lipopolysaccharide transport protein LptA
MAIICVALVQSVFADVSADSIMLRRKSSSLKLPARAMSASAAGKPAERKAVDPVIEKPVAQEVVTPVSEKPADVSVEKAAAEKPAVTVDEKPANNDKDGKKGKSARRDAIITADRTDYDRKEGVVLFDRNVYVNDEQYQMHTDRLFLFLDGTNDLKRLVAIGNVAITNENRRAYCARATFNRKLGRIVMYSSDEITAELREEGKNGSEVKGEKITFWIDSEQVEVENPVITMPGGFGGGGKDGLKKALGR